jgi:Rrf2 family iron-sulfur cluster assembly transcriptional regulator
MMRKFVEVPTRIHNAIMILCVLAGNRTRHPVSLSFINQYLKLSYGYLEQVAAPLKKAGLINAYRGSGGGYKLAKKASEISVLEVISALEGDIKIASCLGAGKCRIEKRCPSKKIYVRLQDELNRGLENIKISDFK